MSGDVREYLSPPIPDFRSGVTVNVVSPECLGGDIEAIDNGFASSVWSANLLIFIPLITAEALLVSQFFWRNGTVAAGNTDVGVYNLDGTVKLGSSGSTANAGTSAIQLANVADFYLPANRQMWLALGCDDGTHTYLNATLIVSGFDLIGVKQQAAGWSSGLPSTIAPVAPTVAKMPLFGFTGKSVL